MKRRNFLKGTAALFVAPAIVRAESLMSIWVPPAKKVISPNRVISLNGTIILTECYVDKDNPNGVDTFSTLHEATQHVPDGGTIHIRAGHYESLTSTIQRPGYLRAVTFVPDNE